MNNLHDLNKFRTNFAPVMKQLAELKDSPHFVVSDNPRRLKNYLDMTDQQTSSMYDENISRKYYYSMGDSYIHNSYRTAMEHDCQKLQSLVQSIDSPFSVKHHRIDFPRSQTLPDGAFVSLAELHQVIRGLKPVNIPRDISANLQDYKPWKAAPELLSSNLQDYRSWKAAPELLGSNLQDYKPWKAASELFGSRDATRTSFWNKCGTTANYPRRSDVPDGAFVSLAELQTAIQLLKPVSKVGAVNENIWTQRSFTIDDMSLHKPYDVRDEFTSKTASIKLEESKYQKDKSSGYDFRTNPITVKELELHIKSLKSVGRVYYPQLKTTFYDDIKEEHDDMKETEQVIEIQSTSDHHDICKVDEVHVSKVNRIKKRSFLSRIKFWKKEVKEIKQTTCENRHKGQENTTEPSNENTPSIFAKISCWFCCCVKSVSTDD